MSGVYRDVIVLKPLSPQARKHLLVLLIFDLLMAGGGRGIQGVCFGCEEEIEGGTYNKQIPYSPDTQLLRERQVSGEFTVFELF